MRPDEGNRAVRPLGGVLVHLERMPPAAVREHLFALRDRFGPDVHLDVRVTSEDVGGVPDGVRLLSRGSGARALASAAARSVGRGDLVVLLGPLLPESAAIRALLAAFEHDPLVGFVQPRFGDPTGDRVWPLPDDTSGAAIPLPRQLLSVVPEHYLTTERLAACLVLRHEVIAGFEVAPDANEGIPEALVEELYRARRRGYRNLIVNRVVIPCPGTHDSVYPSVEREALHARPDAITAHDWFTRDSHPRLERVAAYVRRARPADRIPVLFDCRGAQAFHNGTSEAIHGLLDGMGQLRPRWDIDVLFESTPAKYHDVARRHAGMRLLTALPDRQYAAAVRMDQPWNISTVAQLHWRAFAIVFNMLDTIAWDIVYPCRSDVETTWRLVATHADALLFNSEFTRQRFTFRFPVAPHVLQTVTHHSLHPDEYRTGAHVSGEEDYLLVFGNHYDHKAVSPAIDLLSRAFPYQRIEGLAGMPDRKHNASILPSGHLPASAVDRLVAGARVVVFPSYYEGFGLPVVKALACGKTVLVRSSPLWRELAGLMRMPGRLVEFTAPHELVEAVGRALAGEAPSALPLGGDLPGGASPLRWRDCAGRIVDVVERAVGGAEQHRWYAREHALALAKP